MKHELGEGSFERKKKREPKFLKLKVSTPPVSEKRVLTCVWKKRGNLRERERDREEPPPKTFQKRRETRQRWARSIILQFRSSSFLSGKKCRLFLLFVLALRPPCSPHRLLLSSARAQERAPLVLHACFRFRLSSAPFFSSLSFLPCLSEWFDACHGFFWCFSSSSALAGHTHDLLP